MSNNTVEYRSQNINGNEKHTVTINGKEINLNKVEDIDKAIEHFERCKTKPSSSLLKLFGFDMNDAFDKAIEVLEDKKQNLLCLEEKHDEEESDVHHDLAYEYLCDTVEGFKDLPKDKQKSHIKTVADIFTWLANRN